jgi:hypothetical protein
MSILSVVRKCDPYSERFAAGEYLDRVLFHDIDGISNVSHIRVGLPKAVQ